MKLRHWTHKRRELKSKENHQHCDKVCPFLCVCELCFYNANRVDTFIYQMARNAEIAVIHVRQHKPIALTRMLLHVYPPPLLCTALSQPNPCRQL